MYKGLTALLAGLALVAWVGTANATPITWTIFNSTDSSHNGGVFDYDADTGIYSAVVIAGCCSEDYNLANGASVDVANSSASQLSLDGYFWPDSLLMEFASPLTNSGGVISVNWYELLNSLNVSNTLFDEDGTATVSATGVGVPEPSVLGLLGLGLAGLGLSRRRRLKA